MTIYSKIIYYNPRLDIYYTTYYSIFCLYIAWITNYKSDKSIIFMSRANFVLLIANPIEYLRLDYLLLTFLALIVCGLLALFDPVCSLLSAING